MPAGSVSGGSGARTPPSVYRYRTRPCAQVNIPGNIPVYIPIDTPIDIPVDILVDILVNILVIILENMPVNITEKDTSEYDSTRK